ncbi:GNAT family N-acetyltransferase [Sinorhizobium mexicanum]|uniref:N-acetyltransferase n=1 Tax=Sinorhizobium mexicanum TaxID=375549 RepID=A0A859QN49_9HYPH|nr:GNAT family N-acetyltransferase [Sinorhizobium mexicanum]MBP1888241.1 putative GNAT family acetyltransferase [Sinorhizobium mexicanum]QLL64120.1 N-acetyltransferase [Sinorhizobium mexicanum]
MHVVDNPEAKHFELAVGDIVAVAYYKIENDRIILLHSEVPQEFSGRGIGTKLAEGVFEQLRARGRRVIAKCAFIARFASRHPEYAQMLDG